MQTATTQPAPHLTKASLDKMSEADRIQAITKLTRAVEALREAMDSLGPTDLGCDVQDQTRNALICTKRALRIAIGEQETPRWAWDKPPRSGRR